MPLHAVLTKPRQDVSQLKSGWPLLESLPPQDRVRLTGAEVQAAGPERYSLAFQQGLCGRVQQDADFQELSRQLACHLTGRSP